MESSAPQKRAPAPRWLLLCTLVLSVLAHWGFSGVLGSFELPDLEIEVEIPLDVELGLTEEVEAAPTPPPEPPPEPPKTDEGKGKGKELVDAAVADAGVEDARVADAEPNDGGEDAARDAAPTIVTDAGPPGARLPPGAQIALRVDMARIRESPVVEEVRGLLSAVPDWKALLDGSGIDPVTQLDRLLIATPNLQRDKVVLAGRFLGGKQVALDAVKSLAEARGVEAPWRNQRGVQIAPWANADSTARVIALIGPAHFTISREEDLERVLALAAARTRPKKGAPVETSAADALLSMEAQEGLSLEVDGVEQFIKRAKRGIPQRLRLSAVELAGTKVELRGQLVYADAAAASDALEFWQRARDTYARNALVGLLGLSSVLQEGTLEQEQELLRIKLTLSVEQTRLILGYARELLPKPASTGP